MAIGYLGWNGSTMLTDSVVASATAHHTSNVGGVDIKGGDQVFAEAEFGGDAVENLSYAPQIVFDRGDDVVEGPTSRPDPVHIHVDNDAANHVHMTWPDGNDTTSTPASSPRTVRAPKTAPKPRHR